MILITGATGNLGGKVIETLLKHIPASHIAALSREEGKASALKDKGIIVRVGDYDDKASLDNAMIGIEKVLLVSGGRAENGLQQHQNVVDAAKNAGVKCIAYTSRCMRNPKTLANELMKRHFATEDYILDSGMNYIFFRNILYMDSLTMFLGKNVLKTGIYLPAGDGEVSFALRADQAEGIGNVLATDDVTSRIYNFTNTRTYSFDDVAQALTELSGNKISYKPVDLNEFNEKAPELGIPEFAVPFIAAFMSDIKNRQEDFVSEDLQKALGRKPLSLKEGLKMIYNL